MSKRDHSLSRSETRDLLLLAHRLADHAGRQISGASVDQRRWQDKGDRDPVTDLDREIEQEWRQVLQLETPDIAVYGEEFGGVKDWHRGLYWTLDPIDGTANFSLGSPWCGSLISLLEDGQPLLAVCDLPLLGERFHAVRDLGCFDSHRGQRLPAPVDRPLSQANIVISDLWDERPRQLLGPLQAGLMEKAFRYRVVGATCMELQLLLRGQAHGKVKAAASLHDLAPAWLLLHEYGLGPYQAQSPELVQPLAEADYYVFATPQLAGDLAALLRR